MYIIWNIFRVNRKNRIKSRVSLFLNLNDCEPKTRIKLEMAIESSPKDRSVIIVHKYLFREYSNEDLSNLPKSERVCGICLEPPYYEDETGQEISMNEAITIEHNIAPQHIVILPHQPYMQNYVLSQDTPCPKNYPQCVNFTEDEIKSLSYFCRDFKELKAKLFYRNPPSFHSSFDGCRLESLSVDQIQAYIMVFRRLYMSKESGNFLNACTIFASKYYNIRINNWIRGGADEYSSFLNEKPIFPLQNFSFNNKSLIDTFLYTKFAHQPDEKKCERYAKMVVEAKNELFLEYQFYETLHNAVIIMANTAQFIIPLFEKWQNDSQQKVELLTRPFLNTDGRGTQLTVEEKHQNQIQEKSEKLGNELWVQAGSLEGQREKYIASAKNELENLSKNNH